MTRLEQIREQISNIMYEAPQASEAQWKAEWETGSGKGLWGLETVAHIYKHFGDSEENFYNEIEKSFDLARDKVGYSVEYGHLDRARVARHMMDLYNQVMELEIKFRGEEFHPAVEQFIKEHEADPFVSEQFTYDC